jgi:ketosteroid isomerase-like protein/quercetin dioxygenase-like cupin family protein
MRRWIGWLVVAGLSVGCASTANVAQEKDTLMRLDREWSTSVKDADKFLSYFAPDAAIYAPGMARVSGTAAIREAWTQMSSAPGFALEFSPTSVDVSSSGDLGYTTGTYKSSMAGATESGKYVTVWKKQADGNWKVQHDIFNADAAPASTDKHIAFDATKATWGDGPPVLPAGTKLAVVSGDPSQAGPFIIRLQFPSGARIPPHWHPATENVTVLSGTMALGMGETWDDAKLQALSAGSFVSIPAEMRHFALARTAATIQVHAQGPFVLNFVNPADDPSKKK